MTASQVSKSVSAEYETRLRELQALVAESRMRQLATGAMLIGAALFVLVLGVLALRHRVPVWWPALPLPIVAAAALRYRRLRRDGSRAWRLRGGYQLALRRVTGEWPGDGHRGDEFQDSEHAYAAGLNVFGEGSLFELLCVARTAIGRRALASYLLAASAPEEAVARQAAVRELSLRRKLREEVALLGDFETVESRRETFMEWLDSPPMEFPAWLRVLAAVTSSAVLCSLLAGIFGVISWRATATCIAPFAVFHSIVGLLFRKRVKRMMEALRSASLETRLLRAGLQLVERQAFHAPKLLEVAGRIRGAARSVRALEWLMSALHERNKDWFYQLSLLLLAGTQLCMAIERWRTRHGQSLRQWIDAWGEFEALNALATYAYENPDHTFPEFSGDTCFEAVALGHPLMLNAACVRNDVRLNHETLFFVVSGSNMSGKSSLLRAIGLNGVLALAGAPVRAASLRLSPLSICASIAVADSQLNGKSKFLVEVDRVRQTIELAAEKRAVLFLIDEIFSGTNSRDRRAASDAVVRTLVERGAIGALSTHDMSLTEIVAAPELRGANVHLGARDGSDPMSFDYRLKAGISTETNALAIARMAGVPV